ncbi:MAG: histone deacetylase [Solirubrobacteraceae bacterium]|nr:histone deacetylase [Solirubrobacteraceae bacterium]
MHSAAHVARVEALCRSGGGALDPDTIVSAHSCEAARRAAGGAAALVDALLGGTPVGAALHRPPGHHADATHAMGFCLFNSIAVAARHAIDAHGLERVLVLDWDVHHGNGTNDIFHEDPRVLFASIHQSPLYPGTGRADDSGSGAGAGFTVNLPVPAGSGDALFTALVDHVIVPAALAYEPQLVLVSAGFDAHADDPLGGCAVTERGFAAMAASTRRLAAGLGAPLGIVLEGGYDLGALTRSLIAVLETVARDPAALPAGDAAPHPLALEAARAVGARTPLA